ncbi:cupredoxin family copper-binding protein [Amycolatopsis sp. NPDC059021]|uniref:cupredoxin domain-containing protein n=1 Tax=Amycolatopsis sp. NPDC059021 TaxID=3346704 RepID=UPI0036722F8C
MRRTAIVLAGLLLACGVLAWSPRPASAAAQQVMMENYAYGPAALTVRAGDTVTWMQHDEAPHDVVTTSAPVAFRSPKLSQGQSWSYTFTQPGTYSYYCSVHPDMRATVTVLAAPATAAPAPPPKPAPAAPVPPKKTTAPSVPGTPSVPPSGSAPATNSAAPPEPAAPSSSEPSVVQQAAPATAPSLDPMLLVAGVVTAVAVLCLLLLGSRPSP